MKVQIASDLHGEFLADGLATIASEIIPVAGDVLVLAGDIFGCHPREQILREFTHFTSRWKNVVYVTGNHEYYGGTFEEVHDNLDWAKARLPNLHILRNSKVEIEGKTFIGGTLWFPAKPDPERARELMNDFSYIDEPMSRFHRENATLREFLEKEVKEGDFVVTHHLPTEDCVSPFYKKSALNKFFVGDADAVLKNKPKYWAYGHTHDPSVKVVDSTTLICNPRGYYKSPRKSMTPGKDLFNPSLVVEF